MASPDPEPQRSDRKCTSSAGPSPTAGQRFQSPLDLERKGCRGNAAGAMPQGLCCTCSNCCTGHTDRHAPTAALATQISMLNVLHWPNSSACPSSCTGHTDQHAPSAALATQIGKLHLPHWPRRSACSKCCTGHADQHAPSAALATQISKPQVLHWQHRSPCSNRCTGHKDQHARHVLLLHS